MGQVSSDQDSLHSFIRCGCYGQSAYDYEFTPLEHEVWPPDLVSSLRQPDNLDPEKGLRSRPSGSAWALARRRVFASHLKTSFGSHHRIVRQVGEGTYGHVFEAETCITGSSSMPSRPRRVAVKCFKLLEAGGRDASGMGQTAMRESFEKERAILARLEHPHIVKMYECFEERQSLWVVLELCKGGELYEYVAALAQNRRTEGGALEEPQAKHYFRQMIHAVSFLHKVRIVQRDIKTENFLLMGDVGTPEGSIIKLCDFGTAVQLSPQMPRAMGRIGTLSYTAPEIYARLGADLCADLWSLGVVLYVLLVGASPFRITGNESRAETSKRILAGSYDTSRCGWIKCSDQAKDLIGKLLTVEESRRIAVRDTLLQPWMLPASTVSVATPMAVLPYQRSIPSVSPISDQ
ncbi:Death-associated protein kinase 2 (DAP kinase 2) (DAP-kinase-related protein 1) (DRP-1), partial [Durusdinium trenchii]